MFFEGCVMEQGFNSNIMGNKMIHTKINKIIFHNKQTCYMNELKVKHKVSMCIYMQYIQR